MSGARAAAPAAGGRRRAAALRWPAALVWYVRELLGETKYERYLERMRREHPEARPLAPREFWREQSRAAESSAGARCC